MRIADEVWIAAATLHRDHPEAEDFSVEEIEARARELGFERRGVYAHINSHCVANRPPSPNRTRMLYETKKGRRRLYRPSDPCHARRLGGAEHPEPEALGTEWRKLWDWYREWSKGPRGEDPLLAILGTGRDLWADEPADEYIERLRREW